MTDAVLRFLVELEDRGLTKLQSGLKNVAKTSAETAAAASAASGEQIAAIDRVVMAEASARKKSVQNAAARIAAAREQVAAYKQISAAAVAGSDEQIAADALAAKAANRLARDVELAAGRTRVAYAGAGHGARTLERDVERSGRGILAASGIFSGLGRSVAFASTAFLGGAGVVFALKSVYDQSTNAENVTKSLRTQLDATGISWSKYGKQIDDVTQKDAYLAGIEDTDTKAALTTLIRTTGSLAAAEKLLGLVTDVSAGAHVSLAAGAKIVSGIFSGNLGIAKRYGIVLGSDVKTPLEALIRLQEKFAGQAAAAGDSTAGAFGRAQSALHSFESGFGSGALPVIAEDLNRLTGAISNPELEQAAQRLGRTIATDVGNAIDSVVTDVRDNWPEIKKDFEDAKTVAGEFAGATRTLAHWLNEIAKIVPAKGSLIEILLISRGLSKLGGKITSKAAKNAAEKDAASSLEKTLVGDAAAGGGFAAVAKLLTRFSKSPGKNPLIAAAIGTYLLEQATQKETNGPQPGTKVLSIGGHTAAINRDRVDFQLPGRRAVDFDTTTKKFQLIKDAAFGLQDVKDISPAQAAKELGVEVAALKVLTGAAADGKTKVDGLAGSNKQLGDVATSSWNSVKQAIAASGGDLDAQKKKLDGIVKSEQAAARATAQLLGEAFSRATGNIDTAFDAQTSSLLDNISYRVDVVGKNIHEAFTLKGDEKTPAERELAALDKLQQRRTFSRDIMDARRKLGDAIAVGDPTKIRDAQRAVEDAQTEKKRYGLQQRAALERTAADKAKAVAQKQLQATRDVQKQQLDDAIAAIAKSAEKGKIGGEKATTEILAALARHGVDFKKAGELLGSAFATQLQQNLDLVKTRADHVRDAFDKIADTRQRIKGLTDQVAKLAAQLKKLQDAGPASLKAAAIHLGEPGKPVGHAGGGVIFGSGSGDTVPAMLTPGELVLNRRQQRGLANKLGLGNASPTALFGHIQRFAGGGVVDDLLKLLARNSLATDTRGGRVSPLEIEPLVNRSRAGGLSRNTRLDLMAKLAQAQAHPVEAGFFSPHPDRPSTLGRHPHLLRAGGGMPGAVTFTGDITITLEDRKNARANAKAIREELGKTARANAATRRGPFAGSRIGLD